MFNDVQLVPESNVTYTCGPDLMLKVNGDLVSKLTVVCDGTTLKVNDEEVMADTKFRGCAPGEFNRETYK